MLCIDCTLDSPAEDLALDESLLVEADAERQSLEVLRLWDARQTFVVLGRGSRIEQEVCLTQANQDAVPVLRRVSGGASVLAATGCMFYTVLLSLDQKPHLRMLDQAHEFVMNRILRAVREHVPAAELDGTCDVVLEGKKVSGNSLRVGRNWLLYHGSLLLGMDLALVETYLTHPPREPEYRQRRSHTDFLCNLNVERQPMADSLRRSWQASNVHTDVAFYRPTLQQLVEEKYTQDSWNASR